MVQEQMDTHMGGLGKKTPGSSLMPYTKLA